MLVVDRCPLRSESVEGILEVDGVGQHHRVGHHRQAQGLFGLGVVVATADVALVDVEEPAAQGMEALAFVQLAVDPSLQLGVGQVAQDEQGADQAPVLEQAPGEGVLAAAGLELGEEQRGRRVPELERPAESQQLVPLAGVWTITRSRDRRSTEFALLT